jgi:hypothetical protein
LFDPRRALRSNRPGWLVAASLAHNRNSPDAQMIARRVPVHHHEEKRSIYARASHRLREALVSSSVDCSTPMNRFAQRSPV